MSGPQSLEVAIAESSGTSFAQAVRRGNSPLMERVYFGAQAMLQHRLTPELRAAVAAMLQHSIEGGFDPLRRLVFVVGTDRADPDAALCRYFLWVAVRLNLLVTTWDEPGVEAVGALEAMEERAEQVLRELLTVPDVASDADVRPLHVLVTEMLVHTSLETTARLHEFMGAYGSELEEVMLNARALEEVRKLDDRNAVTFSPGKFSGQPGSTQIARRYPHLHASANSVEQTRSRRKRRASDPALGDRLIDLLREPEGGAQ